MFNSNAVLSWYLCAILAQSSLVTARIEPNEEGNKGALQLRIPAGCGGETHENSRELIKGSLQ